MKIKHFSDSLGLSGFQKLKEQNFNYQLANMVTGSTEDSTYIIRDTVPIQLSDPVFQFPVSNYGRARMFLPYKMFNGQRIDTYWFNVSVIWLYSFVLYIILLIDLINKSWNFINRNIYRGDKK